MARSPKRIQGGSTMIRPPHPRVAPLLTLCLLAAVLATVPNAAPAGDSKKADPKAKDAAAGEEKPFDEVVKDLEVVKGFFTFYCKPDENKVLMEVLPSQMDSLFLFAA